jgi:hypothetical protein
MAALYDAPGSAPRSLSEYLAQHPEPAQFVECVRYIAAVFHFILHLPTIERSKAYSAVLAVAQERGYAMNGAPAAYGDETEGVLRYYIELCLTLELCHAHDERALAGPLN